MVLLKFQSTSQRKKKGMGGGVYEKTLGLEGSNMLEFIPVNFVNEISMTFVVHNNFEGTNEGKLLL